MKANIKHTVAFVLVKDIKQGDTVQFLEARDCRCVFEVYRDPESFQGLNGLSFEYFLNVRLVFLKPCKKHLNIRGLVHSRILPPDKITYLLERGGIDKASLES